MFTVQQSLDTVRQKLPALRLFVESTGSLMVGLGAQAVAFIVLAHAFGPVQFGKFMTVMAVTNLVGVFTGLGSGEVLRRLVSRDRSHFPEAMGHCLTMILLTGTPLCVLVIAGMSWFVQVADNPADNFFILLMLVPSNVLMTSFVNQAETAFLSHDDFTRANVVNSGFGLSRGLTVIVACLVFGVSDLRGFSIWWAVVSLAAAMLSLMAIWRLGRPRWGLLPNEIWLGSNLSLSSFLLALRSNIDILVLNAVTTPQFVGVYGAGRRIVSAALVVPGSFDRIIYGKLAVAGKGGPSATLPLAKKYLLYAVAISALTSLGLFAVAPLLPMMFGPSFGESTRVVQILCWTLVTTAVQFVAFDALNAAEQHKVTTFVSGGANLIGALMVIGLGSLFKAEGIYAALYLSDFLRGGALWFSLMLLTRRQQLGLRGWAR